MGSFAKEYLSETKLMLSLQKNIASANFRKISMNTLNLSLCILILTIP
jgi:hypothetical protein